MTSGDFYKLSVISSTLKFKISLNGVNVLTFDKDSAYSSSFFVNEWLVSGPNKLRLEILDSKEEVDFTSIIILELIKGDRWDKGMLNKSNVVELRYNEFHKEFKPQFTEHFHISSPKFEEAFGPMKNLDIKNTELLSSFFRKVESLYLLFEDENTEAISKEIDLRCSYYDLVYERKPGETLKEYTGMLKDSFVQEEIMLFKRELLSPDFHFGNRLITLDYKKFNLPAINMELDDGSIRSFRFYWALNDEDEFYIIR